MNKYLKLIYSSQIIGGIIGIKRGYSKSKYDSDGNLNLTVDRVFSGIGNGIAYINPFFWPPILYSEIVKLEIYFKNLDKSKYHYHYREFLGIGRYYSKHLNDKL